MISLTAPDPRSLTTYTRTFTPGMDDDVLASRADQRASGGDNELWKFRRIAARKMFVPGSYESDIVL
ncbi:hypothetical protein, partial [Bacillus sp. SIMBA_005]|uniref:hypothetical protein n=1 Tax=Bacillus sp. SIMBA_005 TaxID=3085754 RepID=UPI0039790AC2